MHEHLEDFDRGREEGRFEAQVITRLAGIERLCTECRGETKACREEVLAMGKEIALAKGMARAAGAIAAMVAFVVTMAVKLVGR